MDCDFSPSSPHLLPNGLFSPQNRISFELLALSGLLGFSTFKGGKMLIFQGFANSRIVREFPPFSFKVRIATLTRNQFNSNVTWVRIPPSAPRAAPCGVLSFIFAANYVRAARWDSNSPCPALCVPPGCNSPADCCKGAGESARLRQRQHPAGRCSLFLRQTMQGLQGGIRTTRARRFASRLAKMPQWGIFRARENPTVCAKYHYSVLHWVVIFYC